MRKLPFVGVLFACARAWAQPATPDAPEPAPPTPTEPTPTETPIPTTEIGPEQPTPLDDTGGDDELGPVLVIERIDVVGNTVTQDHVVRRALPIDVGDAMRGSDRRLLVAKFKLLALGYFREVKLELKKGSRRGQVVLVVSVVERGTIVLNRLWFGSNSLSPYWFGADLTERNLLGLGVQIGAGFIYGGYDDVVGGRDQWAGEVRVGVPSLRGSRFGIGGALTLVHGAEEFRIHGVGGDPDVDELSAFPYRRFGGRLTGTYDITALMRLSAGVRAEEISADPPVAPTQDLGNGKIVDVDLHLQSGNSHVVTTSFGFDRDTRPDPILSHSGDHLAFVAELGSVFSDYRYASLLGRYDHYWPLRHERHAIALKLAGGVIVGDAPRFDRIHIADVDHMLTPRALGLVLSAAEPLDILQTRHGKPEYGDVGGSITAEYALKLTRGKGKARVYGSDLFFGVGVWGLAELQDFRARDTSFYDALPVDMYLDAGVRLDTDIGIFELTVANGLGRIR